MPSDNESWLINEGGHVIAKEAKVGSNGLTPWETLVNAVPR
jgi:hypothetical protein